MDLEGYYAAFHTALAEKSKELFKEVVGQLDEVEEEIREYYHQDVALYFLRQYFEDQNETNLKFLVKFFRNCYRYSSLWMNGTFGRRILTSALNQARTHRAGECFGLLCSVFYRTHARSLQEYESGAFLDDEEASNYSDYIRLDLTEENFPQNANYFWKLQYPFTYLIQRNNVPVSMLKEAFYVLIKDMGDIIRPCWRAPLTAVIQYLVLLVFERKAYECLPALDKGFNYAFVQLPKENEQRGYLFDDFLTFFIVHLQTQKISWTHCGRMLCNIIKMQESFRSISFIIHNRYLTIPSDVQKVSLTDLTRWCLENSHSNLALFLCVGLKKWKLGVEAVDQSSIELQREYLIGLADKVFSCNDGECLGVALLKRIDFDLELNIDKLFGECFRMDVYKILNHEKIISLCKEFDLHDWALLLQLHLYVDSFDASRRLDKFEVDPAEIYERLPSCPDKILQYAVKKIAFGNIFYPLVLDLVRNLIENLHISKVTLYQDGRYESLRPFFCDVFISKLKLFPIFLSAGMTALRFEEDCWQKEVKTNCDNFTFEKFRQRANPVLMALNAGPIPLLAVMLKACVMSQKGLHQVLKFCNEGKYRDVPAERVEMVCRAASNPARLEDLARLVIWQEKVKFEPGRTGRIQKLPLPEAIMELIQFQDILSSNEWRELIRGNEDQ